MVVNSGHYHVHPFWEILMRNCNNNGSVPSLVHYLDVEVVEEWATSQNELERQQAYQRELAQDAEAANLRMDMDEFEGIDILSD